MEDKTLRAAVMDELAFEPSVNAAHIGVTAQNGVVTLTGHVGTYAEKWAAEKAAERVRGARAVAQEIEVRYAYDKKTSDNDIAERALRVIGWQCGLPEGAIKVKIESGFVTLSGTVDWHFQRQSAESAVRKLAGVTGVVNAIALRPAAIAHAPDVESRIRSALHRHADLEANGIDVTVQGGGAVRLDGKVHALNERWIAEQAAWSVPGVTRVEDHLTVA